MAEKVILGLSDGVDSAVAAKILKDEGYEVHALYLDIGGERERADARASAERLGIPLRILNIHDELEKFVCAPFAREYLRGRTPNPCIGCNPNVKFPALLHMAEEMNAFYIATGHYVRTDGEHLYMGNPDNDQSYMLARLKAEQVKRLLLPLGSFHKTQVRGMAAQLGLSVADKPDSRENCFIKGMTYAEWIERRGDVPKPGRVLFRGEVIGTHGGIHRYTVGQRWAEMIGERRAYVGSIDAQRDEIHLCLWEDLFTNEIDIVQPNWIGGAPGETFRAVVRARHTRWEMPACTVTITPSGAHIVCDSPLRAPAPGQTAALYDGDRLLGGGTITA